MLLPAIAKGEHRRMLRFFTLLPGVLAVAVVLIGVVELILWSTVLISIEAVRTHKLVMMPTTALCFVVAGASLLAAQSRNSTIAMWLSRILAIAVAFFGLFILMEYAAGSHSNLDLVWNNFVGAPKGATELDRMAINTAIAFVLFAQGLLLLEGDRRARGLRSQFFATFVMIVAFLALVGHIFGVADFYRFRVLSGMSLAAAITFTLLGVGLLFSQLERGVPALAVDEGAAGFVARRLLPGAVFVPLIFTMLRFTGEERGVFGPRLGASLAAVADMVAFLLLIAWSARVLRDTDAKRGELFLLEREAHEASERARNEAEIAMTQAEAARAEAESANGAKSDFLAVMSHELRTPLAAIMGYQELLADGITGPVTEAQSQQLARIKASARHLLSLIDEILTFTRLDAGRETVIPEKMDVDEALKGAAEIVEPLAAAKELELKVESPGPGVTVESDPTKVRQILVNLLSNAVKFTDSGSVTVKGIVAGKNLILSVSDTGIGVEPENIHRIFDPFWQVEQKATRRATGTGLGLTVTRRLANLLGGDVVVASNAGEGTTFTVTLPTKVPHIASIPEKATHLRAG
ncbi:MAG: HAMP domain-containing sensor histidine kinase [Gemmatimonadales bacterium]